MDGVLYVLNQLGSALQQLNAELQDRDRKIAELEQLLANAQPSDHQPVDHGSMPNLKTSR